MIRSSNPDRATVFTILKNVQTDSGAHPAFHSVVTALSIVQFNPLTPNDLYMSRTAPLISKRCILYIYSTNKGTEYFKHALCSPFFSLQNSVCFIMLTCLVPVLFTFYIQGELKLKKKNNSGAKGLNAPQSLSGVPRLSPYSAGNRAGKNRAQVDSPSIIRMRKNSMPKLHEVIAGTKTKDLLSRNCVSEIRPCSVTDRHIGSH